MKVCEYGHKIGIPVKEVGPRIQALNKAIKDQGMAIGADMTYSLDMMGTEHECVKAVTLTVYLFQKEDKQDQENLGNSETVKNPEE